MVITAMTSQISVVALRKESVDRNLLGGFVFVWFCVALRKESVDRNALGGWGCGPQGWSLSARRAWIEILISARQVCLVCVALRKESVDRNKIRITTIDCIIESLSARRAWIEIFFRGWTLNINGRRSPQGERG